MELKKKKLENNNYYDKFAQGVCYMVPYYNYRVLNAKLFQLQFLNAIEILAKSEHVHAIRKTQSGVIHV